MTTTTRPVLPPRLRLHDGRHLLCGRLRRRQRQLYSGRRRQRYRRQTGDYRLDLSLDMSDTLAAAKVTSLVGPGSVVAQEFARLGNGQFDSRDVDFYQFYATANSVLMAVTSQPPGSDTMDTYLRLFASDGNHWPLKTALPACTRDCTTSSRRPALLYGCFRRRQHRLRSGHRR